MPDVTAVSRQTRGRVRALRKLAVIAAHWCALKHVLALTPATYQEMQKLLDKYILMKTLNMSTVRI